MKRHIIIGIVLLLLLSGISYADKALSVYVKPTPITTGTTYSYVFNFSDNTDCTSPLLSVSKSITTDATGIGFAELNITDLTYMPKYICEYKDGVLRKNHTVSDTVLRNIEAINITSTNMHVSHDLTVDGNITSPSIAWNRTGTNVFLANTGDNVGIGITNAGSKLHVDGDANITGRLYTTFPHMFGVCTEAQEIASGGVWYNITWNATTSYIDGNLSFINNQTIVINEKGDYKILFGLAVLDSAPAPSATVAYRILKNNAELDNSYFQTFTSKQSYSYWTEHFTYANDLEVGDSLTMQYISSDTTVAIDSSDTYSDLYKKTAYGYIERTLE